MSASGYTQEQLIMPTLMDNPAKFLLWDINPSIIMILFFSFGILVKELTIFTGIGMTLAHYWQKHAGSKHPWFLVHMGHWFLSIKTKSVRTGVSIDREYMR